MLALFSHDDDIRDGGNLPVLAAVVVVVVVELVLALTCHLFVRLDCSKWQMS